MSGTALASQVQWLLWFCLRVEVVVHGNSDVERKL